MNATAKTGKGRCLLLADEDLMPLIVRRDAGAFGVLYDRHAGAAYTLALRLTGERQAAEDLVQEAFISIWRSARTYVMGRGSVRTWVLSVVRNACMDAFRSAASRRRTYERVEAQAERTQPCEAFAEAWQSARREEVHAVLGTLPPEQRIVLELAYLAGHTHVEIAALLGTPLGTVKGRLRLGLKKARDGFAYSDAKVVL